MASTPPTPSRSRRAASLIAGLAALAMAVGWMLWPGPPPPQPDPQDAGATPKPTSQSPASPPSAPERRGPPPVHMLVTEDPHGTLRLIGQVVDANEQPVAGAKVTLSSQPPRETLSDRTGTFELKGLAGGRYSVVARQGHSYAGPVAVVVSDPPASVVLRLRPAPQVKVRVAAPDDSPVPGAHVELRGVTTDQAETDKDGIAELSAEGPGAYTLAGWANGFGRTQKRISIPDGLAAQNETLVLSPGAQVRGQVVNERGQGVAGARVWYERSSEPAWAVGDARNDGVLSSEHGDFVFPAVPLGSYRFLAQHPQYALGTSAFVLLDGRRSTDGVLIKVGAGGEVCGRVEQESGAPAGWTQVRVTEPRSATGADFVWQVAAGQDGSFCLGGLPRKALILLARSADASSPSIDVDLSERERIDDLVVRLSDTLSIGGVVVASNGDPVPDAMVSATRGSGEVDVTDLRIHEPVTDVTGLDGRFSLKGLSAGSYALRVQRSGSGRVGSFFSEPKAVARAGQQDVRIVLKEEGGLRGKVAFADGKAPSSFSVGVGAEQPASFNSSDGAFELRELEAGTVTLVVSGSTFETKVLPNVRVEPDKITDVGVISVEGGRGVSGHVLTFDGKPVEGAEVFSGRQLVGTGDKLTVTNWGVPGSSGSPRKTVSDASGAYRLSGVGAQEFVLVADHPTLGRSSVVKVPAGEESATVDLVLSQLGSIEGHVTRQGKPVEGVNVNASPSTINNNSNFLVTTGPDGSFRFDRMATGTYFVTAMYGRSPLVGISRQGVSVTVQASATAKAELALADQTVSLTVNVKPKGEEPITMAEVHVVAGTVHATVAKEIRDYVASLSTGFSSFNVIFEGRPAKVREVPANGLYTLCVVPYPAEIAQRDTPEIMKYVAREGARLPATCETVQVTTVGEQVFTISTAVPTLKG